MTPDLDAGMGPAASGPHDTHRIKEPTDADDPSRSDR